MYIKRTLSTVPRRLSSLSKEGTSMPECPSRSCQTAALPGDGLRLPSWSGAFSPREGERSPFMRMEAIRLLLCVLYVRSRATFSVRHQLRGHTQSSSGICPACAFSLEPWQRQRYARAMTTVNFSRLFAREKHSASPNGQWESKNF